jgi:hypothetical protein
MLGPRYPPAVRVVHLPTGVSAVAQHRAQCRAKDLAIALLRARLWARAAGLDAGREVCTVDLPAGAEYPHDLEAHRPPVGALPAATQPPAAP